MSNLSLTPARRFRFGLRTLFVVVTVAAFAAKCPLALVVFAWFGSGVAVGWLFGRLFGLGWYGASLAVLAMLTVAL